MRVYTAPTNHSGEGHAPGDPCMDHLSHRTPPMTPAPTGRRAIEVPESATLREAVGGRAEGRGAGAADEAASGRDDGRGGGEAVAESSSRPLQPAPSTAPAPSGEAAGDGHDADSTPPSGLHQALGTGGSGAFDPATGSPTPTGLRGPPWCSAVDTCWRSASPPAAWQPSGERTTRCWHAPVSYTHLTLPTIYSV